MTPAVLAEPCTTLRRYAGEYAPHGHAHAQVLVGLDGLLQLELDGHAAFVDASCALVVPAGVGHAYLAERPARVWVVDAPAGDGLERIRRFTPPAAWRGAAVPPDPLEVLGALAAARALLPRRRLELAALDAALDGRLHERWDTPRLAALFHLSRPRFHARFVELTGATPAAWLRERRLAEAARLLRAGMSLDAAALQVGYASASALGFALKREQGVGARALRRRG